MSPEERIAAIRERANSATPGPWELGKAYHLNVVTERGQIVARVNNRVSETMTDAIAESMNAANRDFIAHSAADVPWLLDRLAAETERADKAEAENERLDWVAKDIDGSLRVRLGVVQKYRQQRNEARAGWDSLRARIEAVCEEVENVRYHHRPELGIARRGVVNRIRAALSPAEDTP